VVVLEKGSEPGAHILSGAIMDPRAITELFPRWNEMDAPLKQEVSSDHFLFLDESGAKSPRWLLPDCFTTTATTSSAWAPSRWLAEQAEALGVEIFPALPPPKCSTTTTAPSRAWPPATWARQGRRADRELPARHGAAQVHHLRRGRARPLGKQLIEVQARRGRDPQSYGIGIKELWEIDPPARPAWWCTRRLAAGHTYGGSFLYHLRQQGHALRGRPGLRQPLAEPLRGIPALEDAPEIRKYLEGGKRLGYGARHHRRRHPVLPKTVFPAAPWSAATRPQRRRIKGSHAPSRPACWPPKPLRGAAGRRQPRRAGDYPEAFEKAGCTRS
jgi:electron-transferring-flavoprotein dehydrogenase